jgi:alpha-D-xyloside xylohydrolase
MSLPVMVRPGSIIALGADDSRPEYDYADDVVFHVFEPTEGSDSTASVVSAEGREEAALSVRKEAGRLIIDHRGARKQWSVCLRNVRGVTGVEAGSTEDAPQGALIRPTKGAERVIITL